MTAGPALFRPAVAAGMVNFFQALNEVPHPEEAAHAFPELTERMREVLTLIAQNVSNKEGDC